MPNYIISATMTGGREVYWMDSNGWDTDPLSAHVYQQRDEAETVAAAIGATVIELPETPRATMPIHALGSGAIGILEQEHAITREDLERARQALREIAEWCTELRHWDNCRCPECDGLREMWAIAKRGLDREI